MESKSGPPAEKNETPGEERPKSPWETPQLTALGSLSDLVQGGGKGTQNIDGERTFKSGVG